MVVGVSDILLNHEVQTVNSALSASKIPVFSSQFALHGLRALEKSVHDHHQKKFFS